MLLNFCYSVLSKILESRNFYFKLIKHQFQLIFNILRRSRMYSICLFSRSLAIHLQFENACRWGNVMFLNLIFNTSVSLDTTIEFYSLILKLRLIIHSHIFIHQTCKHLCQHHCTDTGFHLFIVPWILNFKISHLKIFIQT